MCEIIIIPYLLKGFVQNILQTKKYIKVHYFQNKQYQGKQIMDTDCLCPFIRVRSVTAVNVFSLWVNHAAPAVDIKLLVA